MSEIIVGDESRITGPPAAEMPPMTVARQRASRGRPVAAVLLLVAAGLLFLAVPRTVGALVCARCDLTLRKLQEQETVAPADLEALAGSLAGGRWWAGDGRLRTDLGLAYLLLAEDRSIGAAASAEYLEKAVVALKDGLSRAPANPYAWARLAYAEATKGTWSPDALSALRMALMTAPYEPPLLWSRLRMSFLAWPELPAGDRELVFQQVRFAWKTDPAELARLAADLRRVNVVRAALLGSPDDGLAFERMLER